MKTLAGAHTDFFDDAAAADATITLDGGVAPGYGSSCATWYNNSTAGDATVIAKGGDGNQTSNPMN